MTTLHRKPRGASEQSTALLNTRYYTTVDILPSSASSASSPASGMSPGGGNSTSSHSGSSKTRRHGGSKYVRRASGFFGSRGSGSGGGSGSPSSSASRKMSTTQLRAFFAACVLVYLSTLYFAEDIVRFGKAVNSDATRQKIFSQWRPMHSAAKQYLRSMVDTADGGTVDDKDAVADATTASELPVVVEDKENGGGSPAPSMNSEREPPGTPATAAPGVQLPLSAPPQEIPLSTPEHVSIIEKGSAPPIVKNEATANENADEENEGKHHEDNDKAPTRTDVKPRDGVAAEQKTDPNHALIRDDIRSNDDDHGADDAVEIEKEVQKTATVVVENEEFDPAQMEDRMEDSVVAVESQESAQPVDIHTEKVANGDPQHPPAAVVPSLPGGDLSPNPTPVVASSDIPTAAAAAIPATLPPQQIPETATETELDENINASPPPSDDSEVTNAGDGKGEEKEEEQVSPAPAPPKEDEPTEQQRHHGRDET